MSSANHITNSTRMTLGLGLENIFITYFEFGVAPGHYFYI
jgi:hypothetical protein